jgi:hypothetical protein
MDNGRVATLMVSDQVGGVHVSCYGNGNRVSTTVAMVETVRLDVEHSVLDISGRWSRQAHCGSIVGYVTHVMDMLHSLHVMVLPMTCYTCYL